MASEWQTAFAVSHKMPCCALLTAVKNYNKSLEKLQDFFFKTETKTKCSRPRLHYPRPRPILSFLSSRRLETKTLVSTLEDYITDFLTRAWLTPNNAPLPMLVIACRISFRCWSNITSTYRKSVEKIGTFASRC